MTSRKALSRLTQLRYELAKRYNLRRNTVRDTLRRAGFDLASRRSARPSARIRRLRHDACSPAGRPDVS
jgi:hypothetical protein